MGELFVMGIGNWGYPQKCMIVFGFGDNRGFSYNNLSEKKMSIKKNHIVSCGSFCERNKSFFSDTP